MQQQLIDGVGLHANFSGFYMRRSVFFPLFLSFPFLSVVYFRYVIMGLSEEVEP